MSNGNVLLPSFNGGEWSELLYGRQDLARYTSALAGCTNALPLSQGPWTRRGGSVFFTTTKFGNAKISRLVPFRFSETQSYILEFGYQYIRFITDGGIVALTSHTITGITKANPAVITSAIHTYVNGDRILISNSGGMNMLSGREVIVANKTANTFEATDIYGNNINTTNDATFTPNGSMAKIYELATTYTEADLALLNWEQSADVLYIFHPTKAINKLTRILATTWSLATFALTNGPYLNLNATTTTLQPSSNGSSVTITASSTTGINGTSGFLSTDVGRLIQYQEPVSLVWTWYQITVYTTNTSVTADLKGPAPVSSPGASTAWRMGLYSDTTGYPSFGVVHEDRLWLTGAAVAPQRIDGSRSQTYESFRPYDNSGVVTASQAISVSLGSGPINRAVWLMTNDKGLLVGTAGDCWLLSTSTTGEAMAPGNVVARSAVPWGAAAIPPIRAAYGALYVQYSTRKVRELAFLFEQDGFRAPELSILSEHLLQPGVIAMSVQREPQNLVWFVRSDGVLIGLTYERDQEVIAWHRHILAGAGDSSGGAPVIESIATIPALDRSHDETYVIVKRYINGRTERFIEFFAPIWRSGDAQELAFHVDSGITYVFPSEQAVLGGLWHLEGQTITAWVDGVQHANLVVTNGKVTLSVNANIVSAGLAYASEGLTMPLLLETRLGSGQGLVKRVSRVTLWLRDTLSFVYGVSSADTESIVLNGTSPTKFTGVLRESFFGEWDRLAQVYFAAKGAGPATLISMALQAQASEQT